MTEWLAENTELVTAWAAIVISACALFVTLWQVSVTRRHNELSVKPMLAIKEHYSEEGNIGCFSFCLQNSGVGPAIIKDFILLDGDKEIARNNGKLYSEFLEDKIRNCHNRGIGFLTPNGAVSVGEDVDLLKFCYDVQKVDVSFVQNLNVVLHYQSIYQNKVFGYDSRKDREFRGSEAPSIVREAA